MISLKEIKDILGNNDPVMVEEMAQKARDITITQFGRVISLYAPIYLSNYCENHCVYCGFRTTKKIKRTKLDADQIESEMKIVSKSGIQNILLLTGESRVKTPVSYMKDAVLIAKKYFPSISLEIYPLEISEYKELFHAGVDGVTLYQETYNRSRYSELHLSGRKKDYSYRYETPERIAESGIRMINMGILLGLSELGEDLFELYKHLQYMEKKFPGVEYSISFPRLIVPENESSDYSKISDLQLVKILTLTRILFPRVGINLSTRESSEFRDAALKVGVTKISAASNTSVGGYMKESFNDPQFEVIDKRSIDEIKNMLIKKGFDPVFTDWRRINNSAL
ncbi:MAG: 2-iminoacetate synthase ThiH [Acidobacteriota bacterium]